LQNIFAVQKTALLLPPKFNTNTTKMEVQFKHTQAKWSLNKDNSISAGFDRALIAQICSANNNDQEQIANAKLIASAPQLLEALMDAMEWIPKDVQKTFKQVIKNATL